MKKYFRVLIDDGDKIQELSFRKMGYLVDALMVLSDAVRAENGDKADQEIINFCREFIERFSGNFSKINKQSDVFFLERQNAYAYLTDFLNVAHAFVSNPEYLKGSEQMLALEYLELKWPEFGLE